MRRNIEPFALSGILIFLTINCCSCKKLVSIPPPVNTITTSQLFSTDQQATEAMAGVYYAMINNGIGQAFNGGMTIYCGASADEFLFFDQSNNSNVQFQMNQLVSTNYIIAANFWQTAYFSIYGCNSIIEGVGASTGIHDSVKNELIGEAEFVRAFVNFYLVNLFGPVPLVTTIDYNKTSLLANSSVDTIYAAILTDLKDAQNRLPTDYSAGYGQRIIPNRWAATALLSRVYLWRGDWNDAAVQASGIIGNSGLYSLVSPLSNVFLINSTEAIWQLQQSIKTYPYNATHEGAEIIPADSTSEPFLYLTPTLLNAFESQDNRRALWVDSTIYSGVTYYYPYKYQIGPSQISSTSTYSEYYMVLRLAEQYLIRAEAEANGANGGVSAAIGDLDTIRIRAGLPAYAGPSDPNSVLTAIEHERQVELFGEWGHRWLDLKRWGNASGLLSLDKGVTVSGNSLLFPIPFGELQVDPNLKQNLGYNQ
jgi:starch-binding outer membrane protein, SusD/RagB family